jgi:hypothetical protein
VCGGGGKVWRGICVSLFFLDVGFGLDVDGGRLADFNGLE